MFVLSSQTRRKLFPALYGLISKYYRKFKHCCRQSGSLWLKEENRYTQPIKRMHYDEDEDEEQELVPSGLIGSAIISKVQLIIDVK